MAIAVLFAVIPVRLFLAVEIDETSVKDYLTLTVREVAKSQRKFLCLVALDGDCLDRISLCLDCSSDSREENVIEVCERQIALFDDERQHTPVNEV